MTKPIVALAAALLAVVSSQGLADTVSPLNNPDVKASRAWTPFDGPPLGPKGIDGYPPSPLCRKSLGAERFIHCLHNVVWHGGKTYFIDDTKDAVIDNTKGAGKSK